MKLIFVGKVNKWSDELSQLTIQFLTNHAWLPYLIILAANLIVRLWGLSEESLFGDDAFSAFHAQQPLKNIYENLLYDRNPPLYFFLLHFWIKLFGLKAFYLKGLSVLFTAGIAALLWNISVKYFNYLTGILVSIFFILLNGWMVVSHELRAFALVGFLAVLSFRFYLDIIKQNSKKGIYFLAITNVLLLFSHYISIYIPIVQLIGSLMYFRSNKKGVKYFFISQFLALLLYLPWVKIVIENIPEEGVFWLAIPGIKELYLVFEVFSGNALIWNIHLAILGIFICIILLDRKNRIVKKEFDLKLAVIVLLWYLLPVFLNFWLSQYTPIFRYKYLLYSSLGLMLLISYIISMLKIFPPLKWILILALIYPSVINFYPKVYVVENWKEIVPKVHDMQDDNTMILICNWYKHREFAYYYDQEIFKDYKHTTDKLKQNNIHAIGDSVSLKKIDYKQADKILYIRSHDNIGDPHNTNVILLKNSNYKLCKRFGSGHLYVEIYMKNHIPCNSLETIEKFPIEDCDMWEKSLVHTAYNDTLIRFYNNFEIDTICELSPNHTNTMVFEGNYASLAVDSMQYCSPLFIPVKDIGDKRSIDISMQAYMKNYSEALMVCSIGISENTSYWFGYELNNYFHSYNVWEFATISIKLPDRIDQEEEIRIYLWNPYPEPVFIDNFEVHFSNLPY